MISQYVQYFTVGWNSDGQLVPVPVLARWTPMEDGPPSFLIESLAEVANNRQCTIFFFDQGLLGEDRTLDKWGGWSGMDKWYINDYTVRAIDGLAAFDAIKSIEELMQRKNNGQQVGTTNDSGGTDKSQGSARGSLWNSEKWLG